MKLNPEYKKWKEAQNAASGQAAPATTALSDQAIPVVSSMDDHMQMNEDFGQEVPLAKAAVFLDIPVLQAGRAHAGSERLRGRKDELLARVAGVTPQHVRAGG